MRENFSHAIGKIMRKETKKIKSIQKIDFLVCIKFKTSFSYFT